MAKQQKAKPKITFVKVKFLKSPTGICKLAYNAGDEGEIESKQAEELSEIGYAKILK